MFSKVSRKQQGISLSGLLGGAAIIMVVAIVGMRLIPAYMEFAAIKRVLVATAADPGLQSAAIREYRLAFDKRATIEGIETVNGQDIAVSKQGNQVILSVSYQVEKPLFANLSLLIDFDAASN